MNLAGGLCPPVCFYDYLAIPLKYLIASLTPQRVAMTPRAIGMTIPKSAVRLSAKPVNISAVIIVLNFIKLNNVP